MSSKFRLNPKRCVLLHSEITPRAAKYIIKNVMHLDITRGDIQLIINSAGGDTESGLLMHEILRNSTKNKLVTIAAGEVGSAATLVFCAGQDRWAYPNSSFYVHAGYIEGNFNMAERDALFQSIINREKAMAKIYAAASAIDEKSWLNKIQKGITFTAGEMKSNHLIKDIIKK